MNKEDIKSLVELLKELNDEQKERYSGLVKKLELLDKLADLDYEMNKLQMELNKI